MKRKDQAISRLRQCLWQGQDADRPTLMLHTQPIAHRHGAGETLGILGRKGAGNAMRAQRGIDLQHIRAIVAREFIRRIVQPRRPKGQISFQP
jgi:hypothetical protein